MMPLDFEAIFKAVKGDANEKVETGKITVRKEDGNEPGIV